MGKAFDAAFFFTSIIEIFKALPLTVLIAVVGFGAGLVIGFFSALIKKYNIPVLKWITTFYTSFIRGTPLLVQLAIAYYGVPMLLSGWDIDISGVPALVFVFITYALNTGAYLTEAVRAAIEAVDPGQYEAASSIGMTGRQTFTRIVLPQAFLWVLPNLGNTFIALLKDTSLAFSVTILEVMGMAKVLGSRNMRFFEVYLAAALVYWAACIVSEIIVNRLELLMRRKRGLE